MIDQNGAIQYALREAVATALEEAKATPIEIGKQVGHTDFATYSTKSGKLQGYEGDESLVKNEEGEEWKWKTEGMVDVERVYVLADLYIQRLEMLTSIMELGEALGVPPQETLNKVLGPPNENCTCEYCSQRKSETNGSTGTGGGVSDGTDGGGGISANDGQEPVAEVAAAVAESGSRFPFNEFLNTVKAD
jgi:hypothetical protein